MPNIKSAIKRVKTNNESNTVNTTIRSSMKTAIKKVEASVLNNDATSAVEYYKDAASKLDKAARKGIIHKNAATRKKARLMKKVNSLKA
ncbi:30S ribosomal protein S20 [Bacillaceae bacterium Marseille-Q3522]|nr:30S ribosomal protein S20 [Bacillaceae bacterium Marseille-Q3522]